VVEPIIGNHEKSSLASEENIRISGLVSLSLKERGPGEGGTQHRPTKICN